MYRNTNKLIPLSGMIGMMLITSILQPGRVTAMSHKSKVKSVKVSQVPYLKKQGEATQLIMDGKPFLILSGELHNSSSSNLDYMKPIWSRLKAMHLNTIVTPLSWELIEPEEGKFDFTLVDGLIKEARSHGFHLVFLWLASWKNGMSSYIPLWVKQDYQKYPRVKKSDGKPLEVLSTLSESNWKADGKAYATLMGHIKKFDEKYHTVLMMQVENEVGVLGDSRDRSAAANEDFSKPVPVDLMNYLVKNKQQLVPEVRALWEANGYKTSGSWEEVFGPGQATDEIFMAWHYARYVDKVAEAGKSAYNLPMYANAWLNEPNAKPGEYPSGGPLPHVMDIWLAGAPHLDLLAPDIYAQDFEGWCQKFTQRNNPLFIPEMRRSDDGARLVFYAIGERNAIGTSPFAIDDNDPAVSHFTQSYDVLNQLSPMILENQEKGTITGFLLDKDHPSVTREMGGYKLEISLDELFGHKTELGYGLIMADGPNQFIGAGSGFRVAFQPLTPGPAYVGIGQVDEGVYKNGKWVPGRRLNGDENDQGQKWRVSHWKTTIERCTVYRFE